MSQGRGGMEIAEIWPTAAVCLISLAHLITCFAAGVGGLISQSSYLQSPHGSRTWKL